MTASTLSRRNLLKLGWSAAGAVVLGEAALMTLRFLAPRIGEGDFGSIITAGAVESFVPASVTPFNEGRFYLVRLTDGGFLALYRRCTHLGCSVPYDPVKEQFVCPCHGSAFSMQGQVLNAPAPRPLDAFPIEIRQGQVQVDTGRPIQRDAHDPLPVVYG